MVASTSLAKCRLQLSYASQKRGRAVAILNIGRVPNHPDRQANGVSEGMPLAAIDRAWRRAAWRTAREIRTLQCDVEGAGNVVRSDVSADRRASPRACVGESGVPSGRVTALMTRWACSSSRPYRDRGTPKQVVCQFGLCQPRLYRAARRRGTVNISAERPSDAYRGAVALESDLIDSPKQPWSVLA